MSNPGNYYSFYERVAAAESLKFLDDIFTSVSSRLQVIFPKGHTLQLSEFRDNIKAVTTELRMFMHRHLSYQLLSLETHITAMEKVKWNVKQFDQHNPYVDEINKSLGDFAGYLKALVEHRAPVEVNRAIWENACKVLLYVFVEGFSRAKQCSKEGRGLMHKDFRDFLQELDRKCPIRPLPEPKYVEDYIRAFEFTETEFILFVRDHPEYTSKQMLNLANIAIGFKTRRGRDDVKDEITKGSPSIMSRRRSTLL